MDLHGDGMNDRDQESGTLNYDDPFYPATVDPETVVNIKWGPHADFTASDPVGVPVRPDVGGETGRVFETLQAIDGGVSEWEDFDLRGRVVRVPSSGEYYESFTGPVGTRSASEEVGVAILIDHLEVQQDPYWLREDVSGAI